MTTYRRFSLMTLIVSLWLLLSCGFPVAAQRLIDLHSFSGYPSDGANPYNGGIQASDGNLYGTTYNGGPDDLGTVFKITPSGTLTTLYSFRGYPSDGGTPWGGLIQASDGNLYGTTFRGGVYGYGNVFKITTAGTMTSLYSFSDGSDGAGPTAGVIQASDGNLYGTTYYGSAYHWGTIFKITTDGALTTLYSFNGSDGSSPGGSLIQASDGNLYGTTILGGAGNIGTVFRITTDGTLTSLYSFSGGNDGAYPYAGLIQASDGNLYGTTYKGGAGNRGTVFQITPSGTLTTIHSFNSFDGAYPYAGLIQASDGNLYGTTAEGGASGNGTIFATTTGGTLNTVYSFNGSEGASSLAALLQGRDGLLYGATYYGGAANDGVMFALDSVYPFPFLISISPASVNAGGPAFTLTVKGAYFQYFSTVNWNGTPLNTTFISTTLLKASVPASLITTPGKVTITVVTGAGGGTSGYKTLTVLLTSLKLTASTLSKNSDGSYTANLTLKNVGYNAAPNVSLTKATLNAVSTSTTLPVAVGSISAGSSGNASLTFPASAGTSGSVVVLKVSGKFTGGTFSGSLKVTLP